MAEDVVWGGAAVKGVIAPLRPVEVQPRPLKGKLRQAAVSAIACTPGLMFGHWLAWTSAVQPRLTSDTSPVGRLDQSQVSWLATLLLVGCLFGPVLWSRLGSLIGRKWSILAATLPSLAGWPLVVFAGVTAGYSSLLVAAFLGGYAGAAGFVLSPVYIVEVAHFKMRGALGSFLPLFVNIGILTSYSLGGILSFKACAITNFFLTLTLALVLLWIPETPHHLRAKGETNKAEDTLLWLRGGDLKSLEEETNLPPNEAGGKPSFKALFDTIGKRRGMTIAFVLFFVQQFCGILVVLAYAYYIFQKAGSSLSPEKSSVIVGVIQILASCASTLVIERAGRKLLLLISLLAMGLSLTSIGFYFYFEHRGLAMGSHSWVPVASLSVHVVGFALGAGPIPLIVMTEVLPPETRSLSSSILIILATFLSIVTVGIVPLLLKYVHLHGCLWFFSIFCYLGFFFVWRMVPETKGIPIQLILKSLNEPKTNNAII